MSAQHTPGPWTAERDLPHNRMPRVHGGDRSLICECGNMGTEQDQWEANARLIAATPELLEALQDLLGAVDALMPSDGPLKTKARSAITKARGEAWAG